MKARVATGMSTTSGLATLNGDENQSYVDMKSFGSHDNHAVFATGQQNSVTAWAHA